MKNITFEKDKFIKLKKRYNKALKDGEESFLFMGDEYLTAYAKYLIEYLSTKF